MGIRFDFLETGSCALIMSEENIFYFTGFSTDNGYLIVTNEKSVFFTDGRYIEAAKEIIKTVDEFALFDTLAGLKETLEDLGIKNVCLENARLTLERYSQLKETFPSVSFDATSCLEDRINKMRSVKTDGECARMQKAQDIAEEALERILPFIVPGRTEKEVQLELDYTMLRLGAQALSFNTIVVSGANSSKPHGVPSGKPIERGDFVTMDFGAVYEGYHSDMTRTVAVGFADEEMKKIYSVVLAARRRRIRRVFFTLLRTRRRCRDT